MRNRLSAPTVSPLNRSRAIIIAVDQIIQAVRKEDETAAEEAITLKDEVIALPKTSSYASQNVLASKIVSISTWCDWRWNF